MNKWIVLLAVVSTGLSAQAEPCTSSSNEACLVTSEEMTAVIEVIDSDQFEDPFQSALLKGDLSGPTVSTTTDLTKGQVASRDVPSDMNAKIFDEMKHAQNLYFDFVRPDYPTTDNLIGTAGKK